jgi:hypothetical protein
MAAAEPAPAPAGRHPLVGRILDAAAPEALRLSAARGVLPVPAADLIYVQVRLQRDAVPAVAQAAAASLASAELATLHPVLRDPACDPETLDHFARTGRLVGPVLEAVIAHPSIPDATLEAVAQDPSTPADTLNLIVTNEVRIIGNPRLLVHLRGNPNLTGDNRRRLGELERDFVGKEQLRVRQAPAAAPAEAAAPEAIPEAPPEDGAPAAPEMTEEQLLQYEEELKRTPAFQKIMKLNVAERVQLAMKGTAEERAILIRDTAKMVSTQVLKSPKLSDQEIATFAGMRSVNEDILRSIAGHRDWTKTYSVVNALVRNPKTPAGVVVPFLPRLGTRDLKIVMGDKNVSELVRRQARVLFLARTQPAKKTMGKKH